MNRPRIVTVLLGLTFPAQTLLFGQSPEEMLGKLEQKYQTLSTLSASFQQRYQNGEQVLEETGTLAIKKPGKMYWEYRAPHAKYFVVDGKKSWFYVPRDHQVVVTDIRGEASTPLLLLFGKADLNRDFEVSAETEEAPSTPGQWLVRLTPRTPQGEFSHIILEINPQSSMISRLAVVDPIGGRNDYTFTDFTENQKIPDRLFKLKLPSGVEVITQ